MRKTRVLLLDDHIMFRQGVAVLLNAEPDMELKLHTGSVEEALGMVDSGQADVVLVDADLGQDRGIDFLERARQGGYDRPVLVLTAGISDAEREHFERESIRGILLKDASIDMLATRIREAVGAPTPQARLGRPATVVDTAKPFTARESEVLRLVIEGLANKEIGTETGSSEAAVKGILQQLFNKTGSRTRSQLVRFALEHHRDQI
jgi:two-component system, NarL family, nitrate/nitrite response regulator NarL